MPSVAASPCCSERRLALNCRSVGLLLSACESIPCEVAEMLPWYAQALGEHAALLLLPQEKEDVARHHPSLVHCTSWRTTQGAVPIASWDQQQRYKRGVAWSQVPVASDRTEDLLFIKTLNRQKETSRRDRSMLYILRWFDIHRYGINKDNHKRNVLPNSNRIVSDEVIKGERWKIMENNERG